MSYFTFLAIFLCVPIALFSFLLWRGSSPQPASFNSFSPVKVIVLHVIIAVIYTTPWDNYLVATKVWWYDPALVTGLTIGWVPIEEYTFFVLQPIMTGLFLVWLMRRPFFNQAINSSISDTKIRRGTLSFTAILWAIMVIILFSPWEAGNYLGLELSWALLPIMLQLGFGADILWRYRRLVLTAILIPTLYLSIADAIAISAGTWTISPTQSLEWLLFGILPIEEFIFFLLTNTLVVFGSTLALASDSLARLHTWRTYLTPPRTKNVTSSH